MVRSAFRCASVIFLVCLAGCKLAILDPKGPIGEADKTILIDSLAIMLAIVIPTIVAVLGAAWWYRSTNVRARYLPDWSYSGQLELIVWSVPLLTIMLLGGVAWVGSHDLDPAAPLPSKEAPVEVQVVSLDWKWLFIYPAEQIASVNKLLLPAGAPIHFSLTSASVMNAFFVPQLGSMIYTMNGMVTRLNLSAAKPGLYRGLSSHYSGDGFSDMHFEVEAVTADRFAAWTAASRESGPALTPSSYAELARQSIVAAPFTYRDVDPHLFAQITSQTLAPGPGPVVESNPGAAARTGN